MNNSITSTSQAHHEIGHLPLSPPDSALNTPNAQHRSDYLASHGLNDTLLHKIKDDLISIALEAGRMITSADPSISPSTPKNNSSDRVTATDKAVEKKVHDRLTSLYPHFNFLGEETFTLGDKLASTPTFICDPIDGTLNFIHGVPHTAVSLALTIDKKPIVGVVHNPLRGDTFAGVKWYGAFLTTAAGVTRRLPVSPVPKPMSSLNECLVAVEWGNQRAGPNWELRTAVHKQLLTDKAEGGAMVHSVRSSGSAALDFCYVAAGWIDLFWEGGVWVWDVAAGWIILEEAGGIVVSANPGDWEPTVEGRLYLAVRGAKRAEQEGVVKELWALMGDRKFVF
ncbi:inositol monophosphatase [Bimuria novae-zelandiae CBS 107.79]|uniref:Inositol-1-monophosphatase n=1 Tax=Bimuria novae-zelandiae CBS 107.79 TaxID=1447943 RepID=A0A6A5V8D0_9PLEO|nr:inositol monophosphatase [Bimuria novae-zelandiae CBS 107.79]